MPLEMTRTDSTTPLAVPSADQGWERPYVGVDDIDTQRLILLEEGHCLRDQALEFCSSGRRDVSLGATSLTTVMQMVANGYGVTLLPQVAVDVELRDERVKLLRFSALVALIASAGLWFEGGAWWAGFVLLLLFEWLFIITRPSATAGLAFSEQLRVLVESPLPALVPLLAVQAAASLLSMAAYPRLRFVALVPAAIVIGGLMMLLIDNFTYTMFGFGILTAGEPLRVVYATLLPVLAAICSARAFASCAASPSIATFRSPSCV